MDYVLDYMKYLGLLASLFLVIKVLFFRDDGIVYGGHYTKPGEFYGKIKSR